MPASKPQRLHTRHSTKAEIKARLEAESAMRPERSVPAEPPARLGDNKIAIATWRRIVREYSGVNAEIISRLDMDLLVDYCTVIAQLVEMDELRSAAREMWKFLNQSRLDFIEKGDAANALTLADKINAAFELIVKLDARSDAKRKMLLSIRQSMYLTPRSRTGVKPAEKEPEQVEDSFEKRLDAAIGRAEKAVTIRGNMKDGSGEGETG